jgi:phosphoserine phosphatase RsbU/P
MRQASSFFTGITHRRWSGLILVSLTILILFAFLYVNARRSVLNEIRHQAMGVAIAAAAAISADDIGQVQGPEDVSKEAYRRIQGYLARVIASNPDVRYIYSMRRSERDGARDSDYEFVVDAAERDANGDGRIDRDETCEPPGQRYDAAALPALIGAWTHPGADPDISPDPPYPDLMSGYAPVRNARGQTVAIVGVDITAATVRMKLTTLRGVMLLAWLVMSALILMVVQLYYRQQEALERIGALSKELSDRNDMLRAANVQLLRHNEEFRSDLKLAQSVQLGFLPRTFPRHDKVIFDKYYLTCEMLGGDLFDVFNLDEDHVGIYMADVAGHGVSAALISGLLKMAVAAVREPTTASAGRLPASLSQPEMVLITLNDMLRKEIPEYEFVTLIYAVLDIPRYTVTISSAGHQPPVRFEARTGKAALCNIPTGAALGLVAGNTYPVVTINVAAGDKLVFFTDGLTEAMNDRNEEFGEARLMDLIAEAGRQPPLDIINRVKASVEEHRHGRAVNDDYSLLVAEIR